MKSKYKIIILLILIIVMLYFVTNTLARYTNFASGKGSIDVAKWNVEVDGVNISTGSGLIREIDLEPAPDANIVGGKIAPGSNLVGSFVIDPKNTRG